MTTTIRLQRHLIDTIDGIVASDYRYSNRTHLIECVLRGFVSDYDLDESDDDLADDDAANDAEMDGDVTEYDADDLDDADVDLDD